MKDLGLEKYKKAICIVAHPDDEIIWMGGTILNNPQIDWTIYSVCRASDADREPKFGRVSTFVGARGLITDLDDEDKLSQEDAIAEAEKIIQKQLQGEDFDILFTHGPNGEYGHERHITVHRAVVNLIKKKLLNAKAVFCFDYKKNEETDEPLILPGEDAEICVELEQKTLLEKRRIVSEMYGYPMDGADVMYSTNPEAFCQLRINN